MKIISHGSHFEIYPDDVRTSDLLPAATFLVRFSKMSGFYLEKTIDLKNQEQKIYGAHLEKVEKVFGTYDKFERSLGIIASGDKGIGKSLFIQLLSERSISQNIPVIIVKTAYPGVADFLDSIKQEVLILFDEFEKVFDEDNDSVESQDALLGLFDGMSQQKRLYALTVNNLYKMSSFMLNRPGRFHYHLRFEYPNGTEVFEYLTDKLDAAYHASIGDVISFASKINLNYDCLRAIAFELNTGISFKDAIKDLNIINITDEEYDVFVEFSNGQIEKYTDRTVDLFSELETFVAYLPTNLDKLSIDFEPKKLQNDLVTGELFINGSDLNRVDIIPERKFDKDGNRIEPSKELSEIVKVTFKKEKTASLAYAV